MKDVKAGNYNGAFLEFQLLLFWCSWQEIGYPECAILKEPCGVESGVYYQD